MPYDDFFTDRVHVKELYECHLDTLARIINDEVRINDLLASQCQELIVNGVQAITPAWMNKTLV